MSWLHLSSAERNALSNFTRCCDDAPEGTYQDAKALKAVIDDATDGLMRDIVALGLKANNCDLIYAIESAIYQYVKCSNPDATLFPISEGFGEAMDGKARDRVLAQTILDRDFLRSAIAE